MSRADIARSDAAEALAYASVAGDQDRIIEALAQLNDVDTVDGELNEQAREALIEVDPVTAAAMGLVTLDTLEGLVADGPGSYLSAAETVAYQQNGRVALRSIVRSRHDGVPFTETTAAAHTRYALAARGSVSNSAKLEQFLIDEGLVEEEDPRT